MFVFLCNFLDRGMGAVNCMLLRNKSYGCARSMHALAHPMASAQCLHAPLPLHCGLQRAPQCAAAEVLPCFPSHWAAEVGNILEGTVQYQGIHMEHPRHHEVLFPKVR